MELAKRGHPAVFHMTEVMLHPRFAPSISKGSAHMDLVASEILEMLFICCWLYNHYFLVESFILVYILKQLLYR